MSDELTDEEAEQSEQPEEPEQPDEPDELNEDASDDDGPVDQLGIPMTREPTIDDVRSDGEEHRRLAVGCSVVVTLFVLGFWLVRGFLL